MVTGKISGAVGSGFDVAQSALDKFVPPPVAGVAQCALKDSLPLKIFLVAAVIGMFTSMGSWQSFLMSAVYMVFFTLLISWLARGCHTKWAWGIAVLAVLRPVSSIVDHFLVKK